MTLLKTTKSQKGFTLIELLVVIAIIGILSGIVLTSLNTARNKSKDAAIKSELASLRSEVELEVDGGSYNDFCTATNSGAGTAIAPSGSHAVAILDSLTKNGATSPIAAATGPAGCSIGGNNSGISFITSLNDGTLFCVDDAGFAGVAQHTNSGRCQP